MIPSRPPTETAHGSNQGGAGPRCSAGGLLERQPDGARGAAAGGSRSARCPRPQQPAHPRVSGGGRGLLRDGAQLVPRGVVRGRVQRGRPGLGVGGRGAAARRREQGGHQPAALSHRGAAAGRSGATLLCAVGRGGDPSIGLLPRPAAGGLRRQHLRAGRRSADRGGLRSTGWPPGASGLPPGALHRAGRVRHPRHPGGQPGPVRQRRVGAVPATVGHAEARHAVPGRPRLQRLRTLGAGSCHGGTVAVALRGQPQAARGAGVVRRQLPHSAPSVPRA